MKKFIVTEEQLNNFFEIKKAEKTCDDILMSIHRNIKYLNESILQKKINQDVINTYKRKNLITSKVYEMLVFKYKLINKNYEIL
jgi:hypothetical protein